MDFVIALNCFVCKILWDIKGGSIYKIMYFILGNSVLQISSLLFCYNPIFGEGG